MADREWTRGGTAGGKSNGISRRTQIQEAFRWVAWWETGGADHLDPDQNAQARQILGDRAYRLTSSQPRGTGIPTTPGGVSAGSCFVGDCRDCSRSDVPSTGVSSLRKPCGDTFGTAGGTDGDSLVFAVPRVDSTAAAIPALNGRACAAESRVIVESAREYNQRRVSAR